MRVARLVAFGCSPRAVAGICVAEVLTGIATEAEGGLVAVAPVTTYSDACEELTCEECRKRWFDPATNTASPIETMKNGFLILAPLNLRMVRDFTIHADY
jgi:hypothetical protein